MSNDLVTIKRNLDLMTNFLNEWFYLKIQRMISIAISLSTYKFYFWNVQLMLHTF